MSSPAIDDMIKGQAHSQVRLEDFYRCVTYGTGWFALDLPSGHVEVFVEGDADEFATDREIEQPEYDSIRKCLRQMLDCAAMQSRTSLK